MLCEDSSVSQVFTTHTEGTLFSSAELYNKGICDTQSVSQSLRHGDSMIIETSLGN